MGARIARRRARRSSLRFGGLIGRQRNQFSLAFVTLVIVVTFVVLERDLTLGTLALDVCLGLLDSLMHDRGVGLVERRGVFAGLERSKLASPCFHAMSMVLRVRLTDTMTMALGFLYFRWFGCHGGDFLWLVY